MSSTIYPTMSSAIKSAITAAIKSLEHKKYDTTGDDFMDLFTADVLKILFPHDPDTPADVPAAPVKAKKPRAPRKPKADKGENISRLNPIQSEILKKALGRKPVAKDKKDLLAYLNTLDPEEFGDDATKSFEEHVYDFVSPAPKPAEVVVPVMRAADSDVEMADAGAEEKELLFVEFNGEEFWVDPATGKVYQTQNEVDVLVGNVGLAKFADMELPESE